VFLYTNITLLLDTLDLGATRESEMKRREEKDLNRDVLKKKKGLSKTTNLKVDKLVF